MKSLSLNTRWRVCLVMAMGIRGDDLMAIVVMSGELLED